MGLPGIGAALAVTFLGSTLVMGWVVMRGGAGFAPTLRLRPSRAMFWRILSVGLAASILAGVANLTTILVTARIASHGAVAVAAYGISARLEFLMIPIAFGVGSALTALVGRAVGAGDWAHARRTAWTGGLMALVVTGCVGLAVAAAPRAFAGFFTADPAVIAVAAQALSWTGFAFGGFGLGMALYFASQGAGRMGWPVAAGVSRITIAVGGGWLLGDVLGMGLDGQFIAVALGITAYGVFTAAGVRRGVWSA
jgi:Na+-driven multidrug efflux pump